MSSTAAPSRPFGLASATALVIANMIGAGVFTTSGFALADVGSRGRVMFAWCVGGVIALCGAISYGGLMRRITASGGEYLFLSRVIHPRIGFLAGWVSLLAGFTGAIAFAARGFEAYALPETIRPAWLPPGAVSVAVILLCGMLHGLVVRYGLAVQNLVVLLKLAFLLGFAGYAMLVFGDGGWPGLEVIEAVPAFSVPVFASSLVWISLSYSGFNAAAYVAGEITDARRTGPRSLWLGAAIVTLFYLCLNAIFLFAPVPTAVAGRPDVAIAAAETLGGASLVTWIRSVICLALLSSVSSMIVAGPRVYARMARDRVFPRIFGAEGLEGAGHAPRAAITLQVVLAAVVVGISTLQELLSYLGFVLSLSAAGTVACLFVLRRREGPQAVSGIGYPVVPAVYVLATVGLAALAAAHRPWELGAAVATLASGLLAYRLFSRRDPEP